MRKNTFIPIIVSLIIGAFMVGTWLIGIWTDYLWFDNLGYNSVFLSIIQTKIILGLLVGSVFFVVLYANFIIADHLSKVGYIKTGDNAIELPGLETLGANSKFIFLGTAAFFALIIGLDASSNWSAFLKFMNAVKFGANDPVFGLDISFFVFHLSFLQSAYRWVLMGLIFSIAISFSVYVTKRGLIITENGIHYRATLISHLSVLAAAAFVLKAVGYRLTAYSLLVSSRGFVTGAGYTDVIVRLPVLNILYLLCLVIAVIFLANAFFRTWKVPVGALLFFVLAAGLGAAYPELIQRLRVEPNEISMETPYIKRQIDYTRAAYDLNNVTVKQFEVDEKLTPDDIENNELTIKNVRLWDTRPLLLTFQQLQEIRTYYSFASVDIDRYYINGEYRQVMLSPRELSYAQLPSKIWINEHLSFTHGYGLVMSPVNKFTREGMPEFFIKDIPPVFDTNIKVDRPQIYYGELSNDYVFTRTKSDEFDYPQGEQNVFADYTGKGGVKLDSLFKKAAFALKFSSLAILLNTDITTDSRIMINRRITPGAGRSSRAERIMPLLAYDSDPYIVVADGKLKWMIDAYTLTSAYPYSEHYPLGGNGSGFNYIRNSVKVIIDAYDGSVDFYIYDEDDPIIKTYAKMFPTLFKPRSEMPEAFRSHVRYPDDLFRVQTDVYTVYQMMEPQIFYNKEDLWTYPRELFYQAEQEMSPYYTIMRLPGEKREEFILMLPFTPKNKDNLSAWMCARNDGDNYGRLMVYKFPKKKLIFGPFQVEARIDQDPEISRQFTLWSQKGSQIIRGNMLVIPISDSLLYVEPVFLKSDKGEIPELKRVIVSTGSRVVMEQTLELALEELIGEYTSEVERLEKEEEVKSAAATPGTANRSDAELVKRSREYLDAAKQSLRQLDWQGFGDNLNNLEKTLEALEAQTEQETAEPPAAAPADGEPGAASGK